MVDWNTGKPNARLWVLRLLRENFGPGDKLVETDPFDQVVAPYLYSLAVVKADGKRRILLVNKRNSRSMLRYLAQPEDQEDYVDQTTAFDPPASAKLTSDTLTLNGLSVAVVTLP